MKKNYLIVVFTILGLSAVFAQGTLDKGGKQLNAGLGFSSFGTPVYVGLDFGVHEAITVGPRVSYRRYSENVPFFGEYNQSLIALSFNGNYHFNALLELPDEFDLYAGLTLSYYVWSDAKFSNSAIPNNGNFGESSGVGFDAQIGGRYFFSDNFGVNLEFGGGSLSGGIIGITYKF